MLLLEEQGGKLSSSGEQQHLILNKNYILRYNRCHLRKNWLLFYNSERKKQIIPKKKRDLLGLSLVLYLLVRKVVFSSFKGSPELSTPP